MLVRDYMSRKLLTLDPQTEILRALRTLSEHDVAGAPVVDEAGKMIGIFTEIDCIRMALDAAYHSQFGGVVADFMSKEVDVMSPDDSMVAAAQRFLAQHYHRFPVVEDGQLVGTISRREVMQALSDAWESQKK